MKTLLWATMLPICGLWLWRTSGSTGHTAAAISASVGVLLLAWVQSFFRARKRKAVLNAYAEREIARAVDAYNR